MSNDLALVAKRIARLAADMTKADIATKNAEQMAAFMGLMMALNICFQQATGQDPMKRAPQEILRWAAGLPLERDEKRIELPN